MNEALFLVPGMVFNLYSIRAVSLDMFGLFELAILGAGVYLTLSGLRLLSQK